MTQWTRSNWHSGTPIEDLRRIRAECVTLHLETGDLDRLIAKKMGADKQTKVITSAPYRVPLDDVGKAGARISGTLTTELKPEDAPVDRFTDYDKWLGEGESHKIWDEYFEAAGEMLRGLKSKVEDGDRPRKYTKKEAVALRGLFRAMYAESMVLFTVHTASRKKLEERIAALEASHIKYLGVWEPDRAYGKNSMVTHGGSIWIAKRATCFRPGEDPEHWQLSVKRGRDAKEGR